MICYVDDDLDSDRLIRQADARSHRLISPRSVEMSGSHDALHFLYAASHNLPILTRNVSDFEALHEFASPRERVGVRGRRRPARTESAAARDSGSGRTPARRD